MPWSRQHLSWSRDSYQFRFCIYQISRYIDNVPKHASDGDPHTTPPYARNPICLWNRPSQFLLWGDNDAVVGYFPLFIATFGIVLPDWRVKMLSFDATFWHTSLHLLFYLIQGITFGLSSFCRRCIGRHLSMLNDFSEWGLKMRTQDKGVDTNPGLPCLAVDNRAFFSLDIRLCHHI